MLSELLLSCYFCIPFDVLVLFYLAVLLTGYLHITVLVLIVPTPSSLGCANFLNLCALHARGSLRHPYVVLIF
jgi:hypothetical protein